MKTLELGRTGETVSQVCLGAMLMGTRMDERESFKTLDLFMKRGGNFIDTANCYAWWEGKGEFVGDESEKTLGNWMRDRGNRDTVFLASKCSARLPDPRSVRDESGEADWVKARASFEGASRGAILKAIDGSLERLRTDRIDLYYVHVDDRRTPLEETLETLNGIVKAGKVRYIGYSNARTWRLERIRGICQRNGWARPVAIQEEFSYLRPRPGADMVEHAGDELFDYLGEEPGLSLVAYSPLLKGIYADEARRRAYYNWPLYDTEDSAERLARLDALSRKTGIDGNSLVLAWMLSRKPSVFPILGGSSFVQYEANLDACGIELDSAAIEYLEGKRASI